MSGVKKSFVPLVDLLRSAMEANPKIKVAELLDQVVELASAKSGAGGGKATTFHRNEDGAIVAVKCYYHQAWMDPRVADFGEKKSSASGFNSMCKDGMAKWTKQNAAAKKAKEELLNKVQSGEVAAEQIAAELERVAVEREAIHAREDGYGFATLQECLADSAQRGL
jgi:hypothetical protein